MALGTVSSNLYALGTQSPSVVPGTPREVKGSVVIPANSSFATTDVIKLMDLYPGAATQHIIGFSIDFPALDGGAGLTMAMKDTLTTATTFFTGNTAAQAGGWVATANASHATLLDAVSYTGGPTTVELVPSHASTNTTGTVALTIYFNFAVVQD